MEDNKYNAALEESENERVIKTLQHIVKGACSKYGIKFLGGEVYKEKLLAWLEKQGAEWHSEDEQKLNACLGYIPDEYLRRWLIDVVHVKYDKPVDNANKVEP